jgi:hypothetical protein
VLEFAMIKNSTNFLEHASDDVSLLLKEFEGLTTVNAQLPAGESAYWTLHRRQGEWRLPRDGKDNSKSDEVLMLPVRDDYYTNNAYLTVIPQPIIMHKKISSLLEDYAVRLFNHYPQENSLARREYGVPMMIGRFDVIVDKKGHIQICELDDVCSLWPAMPDLNPIAESYLRELETQMGLPIYTAELFQYDDGPFAASPRVRKDYALISFYDDGVKRIAYVPRTEAFRLGILKENGLQWHENQKNADKDISYYENLLKRAYLHNEDHWRGDIYDAWLIKNEQFSLNDVALSVRAFRDMPGFKEHLDLFGHRSITMAWERDSKWSLIAENLAILAKNLDVAIAFGEQWQKSHPKDLLVYKTLYSARTDNTAIFSNKGTKLKGVSSENQIVRKIGRLAKDPIVIQPYKEPDTLKEAGIQFIGTAEENEIGKTYSDRNRIRSKKHLMSNTPGERVIAGMEDRFFMIFRSFVIYLPQEKRLVHVGGLWQATDGRIVHGGSHSVAGPLYIDGLMGHPDIEKYGPLIAAEEMVKANSLTLAV